MRGKTGVRYQVSGVSLRGSASAGSTKAPLVIQEECPSTDGRGVHIRKQANVARLTAILLGIVLTAASASAQTTTGVPPFSSFTPSSFDSVNNANVNATFSIPILNKRGQGIPFKFALVYNSSIWMPVASVWSPVTTSPFNPPTWGWSNVGTPNTGVVSYSTMQTYCTMGVTRYYWQYSNNFVYTDALGTPHPFNFSVSDWSLMGLPCGNGNPLAFSASGSGLATDASGYTLTVQDTSSGTPTLTSLTSSSSISIGAAMSGTTGTTYPTTLLTDLNGNKVTTDNNGNFTDTLGKKVLAVAGSASSSPVTYTYTNPQGTTNFYAVKYAPYIVRTHFGCSGVGEYGPQSQNLVSEIDLPDIATNAADKYTFTYETTPSYSPDVTGRLASVTLPTGGTISYAYSGGSNGITCYDGSTATLERTTPDSTPSYWTYAHSESGSAWTTTVTDPLGTQTVYNFQGVYETERQVASLETITTCYNGNTSSCNTTAITLPVTQITATTALGSEKSQTTSIYNNYGLLKEVDQSTFGSGSPGGLIKKTLITYGGVIPAEPAEVDIQDGNSNLKAKTTYTYDSKGNPNGQTIYSAISSSLSRSFTPSAYGVITASTDFASHPTNVTALQCGTGNTAFPSTITTGSLTYTLTWDCNGGGVTNIVDPNGQSTGKSTTLDYDSMWRLIEIDYPDGGKTTTTYNNGTPGAYNTVTQKLLSTGVNHKVTQSLNAIGRVQKVQDNSASTTVDITFDKLGRIASVSNPYYPTPDPSNGVTSYSYDALNRLQSTSAITHPDSNTVGITYAPNSSNTSYCTTLTDEASKVRTTCADPLGRTVSVTEDPSGLNYQTTYTYDPLNNLTGVTQGTQTRTYVYDWLSRLTQASTPESGTTNYTYPVTGAICSGDPSAVCTRTDARNITTTYAYDTLNRLTGKSYNDNPPTPPATFSYDQTSVTIGSWSSGTLTNPKGRLTEAVTTSGGNVQTGVLYSYDSMGRPVGFWQCTPYNCGSASIWSMPFSYDLAGDITAWTHPVGFTITNTISPAQLVTQISSSLVDSTHPANMAQNIAYTAWGALSTLQNGCAGSGCTNTQETYNYNNRLQPAMIELGTSGSPSANYCQVYNYYAGASNPTSCAVPSPSSTGNNGNMMGYFYQDLVNSSLGHTAAFTYDHVNRLTSGIATGSSTYNLTYGYSQDGSGRYGNMSCVLNGQTNGLCPQYTFSATNNRITGYSYDNAGNVTGDGTYGYTWDAEGRVTAITGSGASEAYTYNALGQLAAFTAASNNSSMVYDPAGQWVGQYNATGGYWWPEYVRLGGRVVAFNSQGTNNTVFLHKDLENTTHMVTGPSGSVIQDQIFYPWGQSKSSLGTWYNQEFAGLDFFNPSDGLYFAPARTYNPTPARWLSPDALGGSVSNPQSLNRYAYVGNNPASFADPLGLSSDLNNCDNFSFNISNPGCLPDPSMCQYFHLSCAQQSGSGDIDCELGDCDGGGGGGGGGGSVGPAGPIPGLPGAPGGPGMPGFPQLGVASLVCQIIPAFCVNNNSETGAASPSWFFPPIGVLLNNPAAQVPQTNGGKGNALTQQQHDTVCANLDDLGDAFNVIEIVSGIAATLAVKEVAATLGTTAEGAAPVAGIGAVVFVYAAVGDLQVRLYKKIYGCK
jgi:RHS repeat-associated protein